MTVNLRRQHAEKSLYAFALAYGEKNVPLVYLCDFHRELSEQLDRALLPGHKFIGAFAREHGKSTFGTKLLALYAAASGKKKHIIVIGATQREAELKLDGILDAMSWPEIVEDYGDELTPMIDERKNRSVRFRTYEVVLKNGCLLLACEARAKLRGRNFRGNRPDLVILDDPEDDENVLSAEWRKKFNVWLDKTVLNGLDSVHGSLVWLGTLLMKDSPLSNALDPKGKEKTGVKWHRLSYPAMDLDKLDEKGLPKVLWPGRWSYQKLMEKKHDIGAAAFNSEYMNNPVDPESQIFKPEFWRYYDYDMLQRAANGRWGLDMGTRIAEPFARITMGVDPAFGLKRSNDYSAIVVKGRMPRSKQSYVLRIWRGKVSVQGLLAMIQEIHEDMRPDVLGIETGAGQSMLMDLAAEKGLPVRPVKPTNAKKDRLEIYARFYESGQILLPRPDQVAAVAAFTEEAEGYPHNSTNDDQIDAGAQAQELMGTQSAGSGMLYVEERSDMRSRIGAW